MPIKAFLPGSIPRDEYIAQKEIPTSLVNDTSGTLSSMPEEGWGMSPVDQQTVSLLESSPLLTKKTWRLRLIRDETGCIPVEREGVRNVADNNLDSFEIFISFAHWKSVLQLFQSRFFYDALFDMTIKYKRLMAPFLVVIETQETPSLSADVVYQQFALNPN